jgi:hypothetical protein
MKPVTITIEKALERQKQLVDLCKTQGIKFSKDPNQRNWNKLEEYEDEFKRLTLSLLLTNATLENNTRIKERELLVRRLDVLKKTNATIEKRKSKFSLKEFTRWLRNKDVDTNKLREDIIMKIDTITQELIQFNQTSVVTY